MIKEILDHFEISRETPCRRSHCSMEHPCDDCQDSLNLRAIVEYSLNAERERCAKIAETLGVYPELNVYNGGPEWLRHARSIAQRIRSGE